MKLDARESQASNDEVERRAAAGHQTKALYPQLRHSPSLTEAAARVRSNRWLGIMQPSTEVNNAFSFLKAQGAMHGVSSGVSKQ